MSSSPFSVLRGEALKGHLDVILLSVLAEGPAYGYAIISKLEEWTGGELNLSDGTVYPALHRLRKRRPAQEPLRRGGRPTPTHLLTHGAGSGGIPTATG